MTTSYVCSLAARSVQTTGIPLNLPITDNVDITVVSAIAAPGSISGVSQVGLLVQADDAGATAISLSVGSGSFGVLFTMRLIAQPDPLPA